MKFTTEEIQYLSDMVKWPNLEVQSATLKLKAMAGEITLKEVEQAHEHRKFVNGILTKLGISEIG